MEHKISVTWTNLTIIYTVKLTLWVSRKNQQYVTGASDTFLALVQLAWQRANAWHHTLEIRLTLIILFDTKS